MKTNTKIDCFETPVWALYGNDDDAQIICSPLARYGNDKRSLPSRMTSEGGVWTSRGRWYATRDELIEGDGIKPSCSKCEKPFSTKNWCDPYPKLLEETNLCFHCFQWLKSTIPNYGKPGRVVIGATCYSWDVAKPMVDTSRGNDNFLGHGGREFHIRVFATNEIVRTNNLWCGGLIPERFRAEMPDNAAFEHIPAPVGHGQGFLG